jgi:hypothetical protein
MHELELGIIKAFLIHLIRILYLVGAERVTQFDKRYVLLVFKLPITLNICLGSVIYPHLVAILSVALHTVSPR